MMASDDTTGTEGSYPGLAFTPPKGTVEDGVLEGEELVEWRKIGDKFTIVSFGGVPLAAETAERPGMDDMEAELEMMDNEEGV